MEISQILQESQCPICKTPKSIQIKTEGVVCCGYCSNNFPMINGIPILIDEKKSVFDIDKIIEQKTGFVVARNSVIRQFAKRIVPALGRNRAAEKNFEYLKTLLLKTAKSQMPKILIVGGSIQGSGLDVLLNSDDFFIVESDVVLGPRTQIVFDAHSIPYQAESFDCVISQAVLEHVIDPSLCVAEFYRVLKPGGIVYMEVPFIQQVHGEAYDFLRFSPSGLRYLFRDFEEIKSGVTSGAGTAMAWAYEHLLLALFGYSERLRLFVKAFARITAFWLPWLDVWALRNPRCRDSACEQYFIGRKTLNYKLTEKEVIDWYYRNLSQNYE